MKILDLSAAVIIGAISAAFLMMTGDLGRTAALFPKILSVTIIALVVVYIGVHIYLSFKNPPAGSLREGSRGEKRDGGRVLPKRAAGMSSSGPSSSIWD